MANLIPIVTPANDSTGVETGVSPTAIFSESIDSGSISPSSCFLVETKHEDSFDSSLVPPDSIQNVIAANVVVQRWDLSLDQEVFTVDYGDPIDEDRGLLYRTKVTINPDKPLTGNTNYVVLLSKDLTKTTVFDPESLVQTGTGVLLSKGVFTGLSDDTYTILITNTGINNTAKYTWTRTSDSFTSPILEAKERFIEIDRGIKIKFTAGEFDVDDTYRIRVIPADYLNDFFAWSFSTSNIDFNSPEDENSEVLINLPVTGGPAAEQTPGFYITKITPSNTQSMVPRGSVASLVIDNMTFLSNEKGQEWNDYTISIIDGATAGSESISLTMTDIEIEIEDGVSTAQQIIDAFNASALVNSDFTASTSDGTIEQEITSEPLYFENGNDPIEIIIEFNKDVNEMTVTDDVIELITEDIIPPQETKPLRFTFSVDDNKITITPI